MTPEFFAQHAALITASGIAPEVAAARGYRSVSTKVELKRLGLTTVRHACRASCSPLGASRARSVDTRSAPTTLRPPLALVARDTPHALASW